MPDRYSTSHLTEDQYEPGSDGRVLRNLLGITDPVDREEYFAAVRAGVDMDYQPMKKLFIELIECSLQI